MLSHVERKILNICFHLNRKGQLSVKEICYRSRKKRAEVEAVLKRLHTVGYLSRNRKGQVVVHLEDIPKVEPLVSENGKKYDYWLQ